MFDRIFDVVADKCLTPLGRVALKGVHIAASAVLFDKACMYTGLVYDASHGGPLINTAHIIQLQDEIDELQEADKFDPTSN